MKYQLWVALSNVLINVDNATLMEDTHMGQSIENNLVTQFSDMLHLESQQIKARLRPFVQIKQMTGDDFAYDRLNDVEAQEVFGRVQPVVFSDIEHSRRQIARRRFVINLPIDSSDVRGMLLNPEGDYAQACIRAMERQFDRLVIEAMFADVKTGRNFDGTVTAVADGVVTVDATSGLTYEKLLEISQNFIDAEVGNDMPETIVMGLTGKEMTALMLEQELISGDFTRQFAVEKGQLINAAGIDLIKYAGSTANPLLPVIGGTRESFAMSTRAMCVGLSKDMSITIDDRKDLVETTQVQIILEMGAVRTEGTLIQQINTTA